jgi:hypothetical protein
LEEFPLADQVTFAYYNGVLAFIDEQYELADEKLSFASRNCLKTSKKNKGRILNYLVPVKVLRGARPQQNIFQRYQMYPMMSIYNAFIKAVVMGHVALFDSLFLDFERELIQAGTYLIIEKCRFLCLRNLFRKM